MNNETKWDVFDDALRALEEFGEQGSSWEMAYDDLSARYATAFPDDMPVIPKEVGEYLKTHRKDLLGEFFWKLGCKSSAFLDSNELYVVLNSDTFARAWLLGVWRVEGTGEIVKLEEDK